MGSFLAMGGLVHLNGEKIEIGFEKDSFHYERMMERGNRDQLEQLCRDFLKNEAKIVISSFDGEDKPRGKGSSGRRENNRMEEKGTPEEGALEKEMDEHPHIQEALRLFDGKIMKG